MSVPAQTHTAAWSGARRVLVYRLGSLGDTVVALPSLHLVARTFPDAERRLLTNFPVSSKAPAAAAVLGSSGLIHSYLRYTVGTRNPLRLAALVWRIRRWKPEVLIYLAPARGLQAARRDAAFFRLCGVRRIVGLPDTNDLQEHRRLPDGSLEEEASRLARTVAALGVPDIDDPAHWDLRISPEEQEQANLVLAPLAGRRFLAVSLGTKLQANQWGLENWKALLANLQQQDREAGLVMIGAADERELCAAAAAGWLAAGGSAPVLNLCGMMSPRVSAAVCGRAELFLGHDSGPLHLAACMGVPCVGIYSARNLPGVWYPHGTQHRVLYHRVDCMGCGLLECHEQRRKCILSITVHEVVSAVESIRADAGRSAPK